MTLTLNYDGTSLTHDVARSTVSITSAAEDGEAAMSGLVIEDPAATLELLGHRPFIVEEDTCSQPRLFTGWTTARDIGRSPEDAMITTVRRTQDVTLVDLNALFNFRLLSGTDAKRPEETWAARMNWLLASDYLTGLIADTGYIVNNVTTMDAADYTDGFPSDVLRDLMDRSAGAYTYFAFWDTVASAVGLWVGHVDDAVSDSTLRISNVVADIDSVTTFAPDPEAKLSVTPTETYSEVVVTYAHGEKRLFRSRASTATKYVRRGTKIDRPYTGSQSTASTQAERFLDQHANEQDRIIVTIIVPASKVGLLVAGQRLDVKFSHLTGYTTFTSMRCVRLTINPTNDLATHYSMAMELLAPRAATTTCELTLDQWFHFGGSDPESESDWPVWPDHAPAEGHLLVACIAEKEYWQDSYDYVVPSEGWTLIGHQYIPSEDNETPPLDAHVVSMYYRVAHAGEDDHEELSGLGQDYDGVLLEFDGCDYTILDTGYNRDDTDRGSPTTVPIRMAASLTVQAGSRVIGIGGSGQGSGDPTVASGDARILYEGWTAYNDNAPWYGVLTYEAAAAGTDDVLFTPTLTSGISRGAGGMAVSWPAALPADTEIVLPPSPGAPITSGSDPTVNDDIGDSYQPGQMWINTTTGEAFVLVDNTLGAAVWASTTTSTGAPADVDYLVGTASGGLSAEIVVGTTPGGELGGTWASPTVDATHSGSAHLLLGSTSTTAAAGDHAHAATGVGTILISDTPSTPLVFADLIQNEAQDDLVYADP